MIIFGVFLLALGLAWGGFLVGYAALRMLMGNYLDANLAVIWEAMLRSPYRPLSGKGFLLGLAVSLALCTIGGMLVRAEPKAKIRRVILVSGEPPPQSPVS